MFIVIVATTLVTIIILIITSATYLISLICDESDDLDPSDSLETHNFIVSPTVSPVDLLNLNLGCENPSHHHHPECEARTLPLQFHQTQCEASKNTTTLKDIRNSELKTDNGLNQSQSIEAQDINNYSPRADQIIAWNTSATTQKNLISNQLGASASKLLFDDFDQKEVQLGGTGLHWCKTRKSLDKLIKLGLPLDIVNARQETALHVAVRRRKLPVLIGLLCYGADVESKNKNGETALIVSCKVNDILACKLLLIFDANVNAVDNMGLSARHYAAGTCDKHKTNQLSLPSAAHLILAMLNEIGARRCPELLQKRTEAESANDCERSSVKVKNNLAACTDGCLPLGSYNGNSYNRWPNFQKESLHKRHMFLDIIEEQKRLKLLESHRQKCQPRNAPEHDQPKRSRMLCIDGGGMRGVIVCQIMIEMEKYLKKPMMSYFDWIGGTSVGAFVSCALCTGTSLRELRRISFDVKDEVFSGSKPYNSKFLERVLKRTCGVSTRMSDVSKDKKLAVTTVIADRDPCQLRFFRNYKSPPEVLERYGYSADEFNNMSSHSIVTRRQISSLSSSKSTLSTSTKVAPKSSSLTSHKSILDSTKSSNVKEATNQTTVINKEAHEQSKSIATTRSINTALFDDDPIEEGNKSVIKDGLTIESVIDENEQDPLVWQAVRASAAAPFFFKPYGPYLDGGIISNNPTMDMLTEFHNYERVIGFLRARVNNNERIIPQDDNLRLHEEPRSKLDLVVSLGTGRGRVIGRQAMVDFGSVASGFATVFSPVELLRSIRAARDLFRKLMQQSCQTEDHILDRAQAWCSSLDVPYFRINPPLATIFSIDDKRDEQLINALWQTKLYMRSMSFQLKQLAELLDLPCQSNDNESSGSTVSLSGNDETDDE